MARKSRSLITVVATVLVAVAVGAAVQLHAAPPDKGAKVQIACKHGWRGGAGGSYGGVSFSIDCDNGRSTVQLGGTVGTAYSIRMGVESDTTAIDCFFSGDAESVNESCGEVRLTIR
jgi:hypothetical protein